MKYKSIITGLMVLLTFMFYVMPAYGETADELFQEGNSLALEKNYEEAIKYYDRALELEPNSVKILLNKALALTFLQRYEESELYFDKAIEISPDFADAWHWKGVSFVLQGEIEEGLNDVITAFNEIDTEENSQEETSNSGKKYFTESINYFDEAIKIRPDFAETWYWKGLALYNLEDFEKALFCYDRSIELDPDYTRAIEAKEELLLFMEKGPGSH